MASPDNALEMSALQKNYGPVRALNDASLFVRVGEVHGLIGQNGAGKSTMMKLLSGLEQADGANIRIFGETVQNLSPADILARGIGIIYQEKMTIGSFTVEEALFYATTAASANGVTVNRKALRQRADDIIDRYFGTQLPRNALMRDLSTAQQQIVQMTRTLLLNPKIVVLDEPTAALARREVDSLFRAIAAMRTNGITVIYISHYLREIREICDRVTVLRNGRDVATLDAASATVDIMTELMIGGEIGTLFPAQKENKGETLLQVNDLTREPAFRDVSFALRRGEILGITGLIGSGTKEIAQVLFGLKQADTGTIVLDGGPYKPRSPRDALTSGVAFVPEDRRLQGVGLALSLRENIVLASLKRFSRAGFMRRDQETDQARHFMAALQVKALNETVLASTLSGGNQQKIAIAKWLCRKALLYILDEPSVGIDVAAKAEIYRLLRELADAGNALIVVSSDLDEVQGLCDRVLVVHRGRIVLDTPNDDTSSASLLAAAVGGRQEVLNDNAHH